MKCVGVNEKPGTAQIPQDGGRYENSSFQLRRKQRVVEPLGNTLIFPTLFNSFFTGMKQHVNGYDNKNYQSLLGSPVFCGVHLPR